jgi:hypothetical protein
LNRRRARLLLARNGHNSAQREHSAKTNRRYVPNFPTHVFPSQRK